MKTYLVYLLWQVRLALVRFGNRLDDRQMRLNSRQYDIFDRDAATRFTRFINHVSPWIANTGFRRVWIRKWLYPLRYPTVIGNLRITRAFARLVRPLIPYVGPGRFDGVDSTQRLQVEWLHYWNNERATAEAGDLNEYPLFQWLYADLDVPWSREPESWIVEQDEMGFVTGMKFESVTEARISFAGFEYRYGLQMEAEREGMTDEDEFAVVAGDDGMWPEIL